MITVAIAGARGRMGRTARSAVASASDVELVAEIEREDDLAAVLRSSGARVLIDFTEPSVGARHLETAVELGVHPVIGTTGLDPTRLAAAAETAHERGLGGVVAPNFSVGAVLLMECVRRAGTFLDRVEIIEAHHPDKKDAPSGTALRTRDVLRSALPEDREVPIHSVRLPGFVASQEVLLGGTGERLSIRHDTIDRSCFEPGILLAVRRAPGLDEILFDLAPLLLGTGDGA